MSLFAGKKVIFGVTGGIAAYKTVEWVRSLTNEGAHVTVIMTRAATKFVTPLTFTALSGNPVLTELFSTNQDKIIPHIDVAATADLLIIAPATANTIAKMAHGLADELLTNIALATTAKTIIFPAMNTNMYLHPATQDNLNRLRQYHYQVVEPDSGSMACSSISGPGRLPEWSTARDEIMALFYCKDLADHTFVITAGPTHEPLDPVRYLTNRSTGKMGYALARAARQRGAKVCLISGPTTICPPEGVELIRVCSAQQMYDTVIDKSRLASVVIKAAAISDYRPETIHPKKIKKAEESMVLPLKANPDILKTLGTRKGTSREPLLVGFAAESDNHLQEGRRKLQEKNLDLIVVNDILGEDTGFASETNKVTILSQKGCPEELPLLLKEETAHRILDTIASLL